MFFRLLFCQKSESFCLHFEDSTICMFWAASGQYRLLMPPPPKIQTMKDTVYRIFKLIYLLNIEYILSIFMGIDCFETIL
jgi:hypothetical protein